MGQVWLLCPDGPAFVESCVRKKIIKQCFNVFFIYFVVPLTNLDSVQIPTYLQTLLQQVLTLTTLDTTLPRPLCAGRLDLGAPPPRF